MKKIKPNLYVATKIRKKHMKCLIQSLVISGQSNLLVLLLLVLFLLLI